MVDRPVKPMGVSRRGMAQDSLSSGNLTRALETQPKKSDSPPPTTSWSGTGKSGSDGK